MWVHQVLASQHAAVRATALIVGLWHAAAVCFRPGLQSASLAGTKLMTMRQRWAAEAALDKAGSDANWADCRKIALELGIPYDQVGTAGTLWCCLR